MKESKVVINCKILLTSNNTAEFKLNYLKTKTKMFSEYIADNATFYSR